jgi:hypothetical protein
VSTYDVDCCCIELSVHLLIVIRCVVVVLYSMIWKAVVYTSIFIDVQMLPILIANRQI